MSLHVKESNGEGEIEVKVSDDVIKCSKSFWLSRFIVKHYCLIILGVVFLQVLSLFALFRYSLFTMQNLVDRDLF